MASQDDCGVVMAMQSVNQTWPKPYLTSQWGTPSGGLMSSLKLANMVGFAVFPIWSMQTKSFLGSAIGLTINAVNHFHISLKTTSISH